MSSLDEAAARVPAGGWAVGVSGGADSVALLTLLRARNDLALHIAHLDHETRSGASTADAEFVRDLANKLGVDCTIARRSEIEPRAGDLPANLPARFRAVRLRFFGEIVAERKLDGIVLAHHADDQAETILQRLLRGSGPAGLTGMSCDSNVGSLRILRPLLDVRGDELRAMLREREIAWREDASNISDCYQRNRARKFLRSFPNVGEAILNLGRASREVAEYFRSASPDLASSFHVQQIRRLPVPVARAALRRWLANSSGKIDILPSAVERLLAMCLDAASPPRTQFAGGILVRRKAGIISAGPSKAA